VALEQIVVKVDPDLRDLVPLFLAQRKSDQGNLQRLLDTGDFEAVRRIGHAMVGAGASYGFEFLSKLGEQMETAARAADAGTLARLKREFDDYLARIVVKYS
jgi:HPt (histidine-containing phosphotransfer) domain-containing protein